MNQIAFIFPGQGAQEVGMGREFYESSVHAREIFDQADCVIPGLTEVIFNGPAEKLTSTVFCQPAIFSYSMAAYRALCAHPNFKKVSSKFACGLSLGECTAVAASGALSFVDALRMVEKRSSLMDEACRRRKGAMAAVIDFNKERLLEICRQTGVQVANFNSPQQIVITGEAEKVEEAAQKIKEAGARRVIPLDVAGAFHSSLMGPAVGPFKAFLQTLFFCDPAMAVISNMDAKPATRAENIRINLACQITSSVQWVDTVEYMASQGIREFLEIGPGMVLKGLIRKINPELTVRNIQKPGDIESLPF